jgi:hypothetical protein
MKSVRRTLRNAGLLAVAVLHSSLAQAQQGPTISVTQPPRATIVESDGTIRPQLLVPRDAKLEEARTLIQDAMQQLRSSRSAMSPDTAEPEGSLPEVRRAIAVATSSRRLRAGAPVESKSLDAFTPGAIIGGLLGLQGALDHLLGNVDAIITGQLYTIRNQLAAATSDLNEVFRERLDQAFDRFDAEEQQLLTQAHVLQDNMTAALADLEQTGFEHAQLLLCDAAVMAANTHLLSIDLGFLNKPKPPDILCLETPIVRDLGSHHERLLQFRGVNLLPNGEYPASRLRVVSSAADLPLLTAGGQTAVQVPLPGGLNGDFNDTKPRGDFVGVVDFSWEKVSEERRWMFLIRPFVVRSISVQITPTVDAPVYSTKSDTCYVHADGGSFGSNIADKDCQILTDQNARVMACRQSGPTTANGTAGITQGPSQTLTTCSWHLRAESGSFYGAGAWYGMNIYLDQRKVETVTAPTYNWNAVVNQGTQGAEVKYDASLLPPESTHIRYSYTVTIIENTGALFVLSNTTPSNPGIGSAVIDASGQLTITLNRPM